MVDKILAATPLGAADKVTIPFSETAINLLSSQGFYAAVVATMVFVLLGFFATRKGVFSKEINGKLSTFTLNYALPFLCLIAFMKDADTRAGKEVAIVIGLSAAFYILIGIYNFVIIKYVPKLMSARLLAKARALYEKTDKGVVQTAFEEAYIKSYAQKILTAQMMLSYASLQFFAVPLIQSLTGLVFQNTTLAILQVWNLPYMIGAFSYLKLQYSGQKISRTQIKPVLKALTVPMMLCLYVSAILWLIQFIPGANTWFVTSAKHPFEFTKVEQGTPGAHQYYGGLLSRFPVIAKPIQVGSGLVSPLAWLVIGGSLATANLKEAGKDKDVWITTIRKTFVMPLAIFLFGLIIASLGWLSPGTTTLLVILAACPPAAVTIIFSAAYKHEHSGYTAAVNSLSTLVCLVTIPIWTLISFATYNAIPVIV